MIWLVLVDAMAMDSVDGDERVSDTSAADGVIHREVRRQVRYPSCVSKHCR